MLVMRYGFDLIADVFFSFILYYYMFSKLTHSLFVFAGLALWLRNRSSIRYECWRLVLCRRLIWDSDSDNGERDILT